MNCKYCGAELDAEARVCPECGKAVEEAPKQNVSVGKIIAATAVCVILILLLAVAVIYGITGKLPYLDKLVGTDPTGEPTVESTAAPTSGATTQITPEDLGMVIEGLVGHATFFADDDAMKSAAETVVARVGDRELTNAQLQICFWMEFYNFINSNSSYLSYYGLDPTAPLGEQYVMGSEITWEQYFMDVALQAWHRYTVLSVIAGEQGFQPDEEFETTISGIGDSLKKMAEQNQYASVDELLWDDMGTGASEAAYIEYMTLYYGAMAFVDHIYTHTELTREEVEAYFDAHADEISSQYGISKDTGLLVDVRHVLIQPEGATTDSNGHIVATEEQWEACRKDAQKLLDDWAAAGAKEEDFAAMAKEHSVDGGSNTTGGLYQYVSAGQMVQNFNDWIFDESRKAGDYGLVKTEFGYHLMYFVGGDDAWYIYGQDLAMSGTVNDMVEKGLEERAMQVEMDKIVLNMAKALIEEEEPAETTTPATTGAAQ